MSFAGWFRELPSGMSYRLWEQGGHERQPGEVALYTVEADAIRDELIADLTEVLTEAREEIIFYRDVFLAKIEAAIARASLQK